MSTVLLDRLAHFVRVPVSLGGDELRFLVDTGIGPTVVSSAVAARPDVQPLGESYAGRRMSGQVVEAPTVRLPALGLGDHVVEDHTAVVVDLGEGFDGIVGPAYFVDRATTTDVVAGTFTVHERGAALEGIAVPVDVHRDRLGADPFVDLVLPSGRTVSVEVDTGSDALILDARFMSECGLSPDSDVVTTREGVDDTGHGYVRYDAVLRGSARLAAAPETALQAPKVIFQEIIHDGLVGTQFLYRYRFSFDLAGERIVLATLSDAPAR